VWPPVWKQRFLLRSYSFQFHETISWMWVPPSVTDVGCLTNAVMWLVMENWESNEMSVEEGLAVMPRSRTGKFITIDHKSLGQGQQIARVCGSKRFTKTAGTKLQYGKHGNALYSCFLCWNSHAIEVSLTHIARSMPSQLLNAINELYKYNSFCARETCSLREENRSSMFENKVLTIITSRPR
jgi:hypothetical protein